MTKAQRIKILKVVSSHLAVLCIILVLTFAQIDARVAPFAFAFLFATLYLPVNKIVMSVAAFLFSLFVYTDRSDIFCALFTVGLFLALVWLVPKLREKYKNKKKWHKYKIEYIIVIFTYVLSHILRIYFAQEQTLTDIYQAIINVIIGTLFLSASLIVIIAIRTRRTQIPWTIDQKVCLGVFAVIFALGLSGLDTSNFSFHKFVAVFIILASTAMFDAKGTLIVAVCLGLGRALVELNLDFVAIYTLLALASVAFKARNRFFSVTALIVTDIVLWFYFGAYYESLFVALAPTFFGTALALTLPHALSKYFNFSRYALGGYLVSKNTINKNRQGIYSRLSNLSNVFNEMQNIYKGLVQGSIPAEQTSKMIASNLLESVCGNCPNRPTCHRENTSIAEIEASFQKLCYIGLGRGAVNFLDLPPNMTIKCSRLNSVLNAANSAISRTKTSEKAHVHMDASKVLMASLLLGISKLCKSFADEACSNIVFDQEKAEHIKTHLLQAGIVASDCLITKNNTNKSNEFNISVLVPRTTSAQKIEQVISRCIGHKVQTDEITDSDTAGFSIVTVKTAPRFALTFGVAQVSKDFNPQNGDTFSFLKITNDKTMMAVCDGMGAGEQAHRASVLALSLVENFYKAGFPNEIIMTSVNQLLTLTGGDVFTALDIAIFNLSDGLVNFIKVGACDGYIKRAREVEVIEAGSLPLGIVEEMAPKITRAHLVPGDMVVICSDGIADSFGDRVALANYINNLSGEIPKSLNAENPKPLPQRIADEIISEALNRTSKTAIDDCTVTVALLSSR